MDALTFNPLQSNVAGVASAAADAALTDGSIAGIDFSALLALGLSASSQDAPALDAETKPETGAATANDAQTPLTDLVIALPQPGTEAIARSAIAASAPATESPTTQPTSAPPAAPGIPDGTTIGSGSASTAGRTPAATVAEQPANIAANAEKAAQSSAGASEIQNVEQRADGAPDSQKGIEGDQVLHAVAGMNDGVATSDGVAANPATATHAVHVQPMEGRAPLTQPSALLEVQAPVSEPGFAQALSRQVVWMVDKDAQIAELRINPPELGPVEVRLTLTQDSAAAEFVSPHAEVRAALEGAIVRLREAMAEAGIQLGEASVSAESFSERADAQAQNRNARDGYRDAPFTGGEAVSSSSVPASPRRGLVDVFA